MKLKHQTEAEFLERFREKFKSSEGEETFRLASFIIDKIDDGSFADLKLRNIFGLTAGQWTTLKVKLKALQNAKKAIQSAKGE